MVRLPNLSRTQSPCRTVISSTSGAVLPLKVNQLKSMVARLGYSLPGAMANACNIMATSLFRGRR